PLISAEQRNLLGHAGANEMLQRLSADVLDDAGDHVALALDCASHDGLAGAGAASAGMLLLLVPMPVLVLAADERLIDFHDAAKLLLGLLVHQRRADFVAHQPSGLDGAETHVAAKLASADTLLAGHHEVRELVPVAERLIRVLEDRTHGNGKTIPVW